MLGTTDRHHFRYPHAYAIVRFDWNRTGEDGATVVKVISSQDLAEKSTPELREREKAKHI